MNSFKASAKFNRGFRSFTLFINNYVFTLLAQLNRVLVYKLITKHNGLLAATGVGLTQSVIQRGCAVRGGANVNRPNSAVFG